MFDLPDSPTRQGMEELARRFAEARPEAAIVLTPHGTHVDGHLSVVRAARLEGDAHQWTDADTHYEGPGDPELADACVEELRSAGLPAVGVLFGAGLATGSTMPLDWGASIPLWFMRAPAVVVTPCRALRNEEQMRAGAALAAATGARRVAFIASADHGHGHVADAPYGYSADSAPYDAAIVELVRGNRLAELAGWDARFAVDAKADSFWQLLMLHGALGEGFESELLSYEVPTYFGMLTAAFRPR